MKDTLIADVWTMFVEYVNDRDRAEVAANFVNTLLGHGVKERALNSVLGIDDYLDDAITNAMALDEDVEDEDVDGDFFYDEED